MSSDWQTVSSKRITAASGGPPLAPIILAQAATGGSKYVAPSKREPTYDDMFGYALPAAGGAAAVKVVKGKAPPPPPKVQTGPAAADLVKALAAADEKTRAEAAAEAKALEMEKPVDDYMANQLSILQYGVTCRCLSIPARAQAAAKRRQMEQERQRYILEYGDQPPFYEQQAQEQESNDAWDHHDWDDRQSESSGDMELASAEMEYEFSVSRKRGNF